MAQAKPKGNVARLQPQKRRAKLVPVKTLPHPEEWRNFGYSGEPETCLWCGEKLQRHYSYDARKGKRSAKTALHVTLGGKDDGMFDLMRCGYQFGAWLASQGDRLG